MATETVKQTIARTVKAARDGGDSPTEAQVRKAEATLTEIRKGSRKKRREVEGNLDGFGLHKGHADAAKRKGKLIGLDGARMSYLATQEPKALRAGKYVYRDGKFVPADEVKAERKDAPAVLDDKLYAGFNPGLRMHVRGRTHEREILKARGLRPLFG